VSVRKLPVEDQSVPLSPVIPAKAGIQAGRTTAPFAWTPAFAGVTQTS
jgi:hypothetical protein